MRSETRATTTKMTTVVTTMKTAVTSRVRVIVLERLVKGMATRAAPVVTTVPIQMVEKVQFRR